MTDDPFTSSLGIQVEAHEPGYCRTSVTVTRAMLNGAGVPQGGLIFSLAHRALDGASSSDGVPVRPLTISISFVTSVPVGTRLLAEAREAHRDGHTSLYFVRVTDESGRLVALCEAMA
jgi:acyl-CoA thioesterase